jgi:hypothetical protein
VHVWDLDSLFRFITLEFLFQDVSYIFLLTQANVSYVLFYSMAISINFLLFFLIEYFWSPQGTTGLIPSFLAGINKNQLLFFLVANLGTGFVNMSFDTLNVPDFNAAVILMVYLFVLCFLSFCKR